MPASSGNDGVGGTGWNYEVVTPSGWAEPGESVLVEYMDQRYPLTTAASGCWLFVAPTADPDELPRLADQHWRFNIEQRRSESGGASRAAQLASAPQRR